MRGALDVHRELLDRDVPHEIVRLASRLVSADDLQGALGLQHGCVAVRCYLVERHDGSSSFTAVLVPAGEVPSPALLLDALSARSVRPARPEQVNAATDCVAGLVCPVGMPPAVEVLADSALERSPTSYCALGEGGVALGIRTPDLLAVLGVRTQPLTGAAGTQEQPQPQGQLQGQPQGQPQQPPPQPHGPAADPSRRTIRLDAPSSLRPAP